MSRPLSHGMILAGVITTPDLRAALADYQGKLGLALVERGVLGDKLAVSWGCPASAGRAMATLQPLSGAHCFIRLVEQPLPENFRPTTSFGWASYEITVQDVMNWPQRLEGSGFDIIGPPKEIPAIPYFIAMQMLGRGKEMIYLNQTLANTPSNDLPFAQSLIDHIFIAILATPDREATTAWYRDRLLLDQGDTYTIAYSMINKAFGLPADALSSLTMVQKGRMPVVEIDDYPAQARAREAHANCLPPGNALVTLAVDKLDALDVSFLSAPANHSSPVYGGRRSATARGLAGELIELVECTIS